MHRSRSSRPQRDKSQGSVAQPDKAKTALRFEKEQKTMKKKSEGSFQQKEKKSQRPQPKQHRQNNINYTRAFLNGDFDDDYYDDEF